jgi:hypothetical protein
VSRDDIPDVPFDGRYQRASRVSADGASAILGEFLVVPRAASPMITIIGRQLGLRRGLTSPGSFEMVN